MSVTNRTSARDIEAIDRLRAALVAVDARVLGALLPGLEPASVAEIIDRSFPMARSWVDGTVEHWWSWHDGIDHTAKHGVSATLSPYGFFLGHLDDCLEIYEEFLPLGGIEDQIIPLSTDETGDRHVLRRESSDLPWEMWYMTKEFDLMPASRDRQLVYFADYINTLADAIETGRLIQRNPGGGFFNPDEESSEYPWRASP